MAAYKVNIIIIIIIIDSQKRPISEVTMLRDVRPIYRGLIHAVAAVFLTCTASRYFLGSPSPLPISHSLFLFTLDDMLLFLLLN